MRGALIPRPPVAPVWALALFACGTPSVQIEPERPTALDACPTQAPAPELLPGAPADRQSLDYWLGRDTGLLDRVWMTPSDIDAYNGRLGRNAEAGLVAQRDLRTAPTLDELQRDLQPRLKYVGDELRAGHYVHSDGRTASAAELAALSQPLGALQPTLHVATSDIPMRCGPLDDALHKPESSAFDRNACSTIRAQEPVQRLLRWHTPGGDMWLVRTRYALGFIPAAAPLSPPVPAARFDEILTGERMRSEGALSVRLADGTTIPVSKHTLLPLSQDGTQVWVATSRGLQPAPLQPGLSTTRRPLTRRALLTSAFSFMDSPYGFGGQGGGRDCSRFLLDLFESFDLALPRHSGWQAQAGAWHVDFDETTADATKLKALDAAHAQGVVLLYFPGHIMLYLGRDGRGTPMALHSLGEYAEACPGGGETVRHVGRMVVTDLQLGRGSSRTAFIERIKRLVVIGASPPPDARTPHDAGEGPGAGPQPAAPAADACKADVDHRIFTSPARPAIGQALRVIATTSEDPGDSRLRVFGPDQQALKAETHVLGGPPFTRWMRIEPGASGYYTAVLRNADRIVACKRFAVRRIPFERPPEEQGAPVWTPRWKWEHDTENLWSAFVEQLFDYPPEDARTWSNLHDLLRDPERNLLYNHLGLEEEQRLELQPDCADLPYTLRAYFAWKLRLPYAFRRCNRGRPGRPPSCGDLHTCLVPRTTIDEVDAFQRFARLQVQRGVHSASGRTHPGDSDSDLYPVALTRRALPPGTVYADPHGHVMLLSHWHPQGEAGSGQYGILIAAEAQPDGTVGRRRFWRGSFLFEPSTDDVGAGFKRFRPLVYDPRANTISAIDNAGLRNSRTYEPHSLAQYELSKDEFYAHMDALINPRPLDARLRMRSLIDALHESVKRRITAVDNGEKYMARVGYTTIEMPSGYALFETKGAWEDYSTPARDMRMLVSLDTVLSFPAQVGEAPERYGLPRGDETIVATLRSELDAALRGIAFSYTRSDGTPQRLTLADVAARREALEMAYNPNDCVERRWGAPEGSDESSTCGRSAPAAQRARMTEYRRWFRERARPPRGTR